MSKAYAEEIQTDYYGRTSRGLFGKGLPILIGIINGIDYEENNPNTDKRIYAPFSAEKPDGKQINKLSLQRDKGLEQNAEIPLVRLIRAGRPKGRPCGQDDQRAFKYGTPVDRA